MNTLSIGWLRGTRSRTNKIKFLFFAGLIATRSDSCIASGSRSDRRKNESLRNLSYAKAGIMLENFKKGLSVLTRASYPQHFSAKVNLKIWFARNTKDL